MAKEVTDSHWCRDHPVGPALQLVLTLKQPSVGREEVGVAGSTVGPYTWWPKSEAEPGPSSVLQFLFWS